MYSSIDHHGRYAYGNQAHAALWNLTRLAEALLPVLEQEAGGREAAVASGASFARRLRAAVRGGPTTPGCGASSGLFTEQAGDAELAQDLLTRMAANRADFTLTFRRLCDAAEGDAGVREQFADPTSYDSWAEGWLCRLAAEPVQVGERAAAMRLVNPNLIST